MYTSMNVTAPITQFQLLPIGSNTEKNPDRHNKDKIGRSDRTRKKENVSREVRVGESWGPIFGEGICGKREGTSQHEYAD